MYVNLNSYQYLGKVYFQKTSATLTIILWFHQFSKLNKKSVISLLLPFKPINTNKTKCHILHCSFLAICLNILWRKYLFISFAYFSILLIFSPFFFLLVSILCISKKLIPYVANVSTRVNFVF